MLTPQNKINQFDEDEDDWLVHEGEEEGGEGAAEARRVRRARRRQVRPRRRGVGGVTRHDMDPLPGQGPPPTPPPFCCSCWLGWVQASTPTH